MANLKATIAFPCRQVDIRNKNGKQKKVYEKKNTAYFEELQLSAWVDAKRTKVTTMIVKNSFEHA